MFSPYKYLCGYKAGFGKAFSNTENVFVTNSVYKHHAAPLTIVNSDLWNYAALLVGLPSKCMMTKANLNNKELRSIENIQYTIPYQA